jgi:hypothetical protein
MGSVRPKSDEIFSQSFLVTAIWREIVPQQGIALPAHGGGRAAFARGASGAATAMSGSTPVLSQLVPVTGLTERPNGSLMSTGYPLT